MCRMTWRCGQTVADPGGGVPRGPWPPPSPVQISHKKDGRGHMDFMFLGPLPLPGRWIRCWQIIEMS